MFKLVKVPNQRTGPSISSAGGSLLIKVYNIILMCFLKEFLLPSLPQLYCVESYAREKNAVIPLVCFHSPKS